MGTTVLKIQNYARKRYTLGIDALFLFNTVNRVHGLLFEKQTIPMKKGKSNNSSVVAFAVLIREDEVNPSFIKCLSN